MKKMIFTFTVLGIVNAMQPAEPHQNNLDKVFAYYAQVTNHTHQDLFLSEAVGDLPGDVYSKEEIRLILLKPGKTVKNVPITLRPVRSGDAIIRDATIKVSDERNNVRGALFITIRPRINPADLDGIRVMFNSIRTGPGIITYWSENIDLVNQKKIGLGINLDLKGNDLSESLLDVTAEVR
ncbi:MAG: hypothetical protein ACOYT8_02575 [Candidatus Dependentiae bacterium]